MTRIKKKKTTKKRKGIERQEAKKPHTQLENAIKDIHKLAEWPQKWTLALIVQELHMNICHCVIQLSQEPNLSFHLTKSINPTKRN